MITAVAACPKKGLSHGSCFSCACKVLIPHQNKLMELKIVIDINNTYMDRQMYGYISFPSACARAGTVVLSLVLCVLARTLLAAVAARRSIPTLCPGPAQPL